MKIGKEKREFLIPLTGEELHSPETPASTDTTGAEQ